MTGCVTIGIICGFCTMCSSMDDKQRAYNSIQLPLLFLGSPDTCAHDVYQALLESPLEGPGCEAILVCAIE